MEIDETLDFLSPNFDPVKALQATQLELPCPEVEPCDNLEQYASLMKGLKKDTGQDSVTGRNEETHFDKLDSLEQPFQFGRKTVLDFMTNPNDGPMALLQESHTHKRYVQVWIRHCHGLRGYCQGCILAFDRHLNIVLEDVTEYYTPLRTVSNKGKKRKKRKKKNKEKEELSEPLPLITREMLSVASNDVDKTFSQQKWELIRHVNQLFIRGDNVVLIRPVSHIENETITKDIT